MIFICAKIILNFVTSPSLQTISNFLAQTTGWLELLLPTFMHTQNKNLGNGFSVRLTIFSLSFVLNEWQNVDEIECHLFAKCWRHFSAWNCAIDPKTTMRVPLFYDLLRHLVKNLYFIGSKPGSLAL